MKNILFPLIIILFLASCGPKYYIVADRDEQGKIISVREMTEAEKAEAMRVQKATLTYDTVPHFRLPHSKSLPRTTTPRITTPLPSIPIRTPWHPCRLPKARTI